MILIGQFDSPFVRRVAIAMTIYGQAFTHYPWSVFGDADKIRAYNPLTRVPTLVLDDGRVVVESAYILDLLDERAGPERALIARSGPDRQKALYLIALSTGFADKVVSLFYEMALHDVTSDKWTSRLDTQIRAVLERLEAERVNVVSEWLLGQALTHADIALGCALRHAMEALGDHIDWSRYPSLVAHSERCEALDVFRTVYQAFDAPGLPPKKPG